jgi:uncharacterized repeat protein (TIGR03803 family)
MSQSRDKFHLTRFVMLPVATVSMLLIGVATSSLAYGQTFSVIHYFTGGPDGNYPAATLTLDRGGRLYGTTLLGGIQSCAGGGCGVAFRLDGPGSGWTLNTLFEFPNNASVGMNPAAPLTFGPDGALYGTTEGGPGCSGGCGVVFRLVPPLSPCQAVVCRWTESVIYAFHGGTDGVQPGRSPVTFDAAGNAYGSTYNGGANGHGTIWKLSRNGSQWVESIVYSFNGSGDGSGPQAGVILDAAGNLYGTALLGGDLTCAFGQGCGTVFQLSPSGSGWTETTLYTFEDDSFGLEPSPGLVFDASGNLYGAAAVETLGYAANILEFQHVGSSWNPSILTTLRGNIGPASALTIDAHGNLYGTTVQGGAHFEGSVFELSPQNGSWVYTDLHDFHIDDGWRPVGGVTLAPNGNLYGTAAQGGTGSCFNGCGVVWEITP